MSDKLSRLNSINLSLSQKQELIKLIKDIASDAIVENIDDIKNQINPILLGTINDDLTEYTGGTYGAFSYKFTVTPNDKIKNIEPDFGKTYFIKTRYNGIINFDIIDCENDDNTSIYGSNVVKLYEGDFKIIDVPDNPNSVCSVYIKISYKKGAITNIRGYVILEN